ncbi:hypothetical protein KW846_12800 [Pseudomonas sp. PDM32]|uniref:hypothetical protein n=1 Tax=Pseudomonas sp. PDM32 TaxID=2854768 RepID=UPI001C47DBCC|nr:hypothetical protein [Pseudomonas sp. PDM32]MBV7573569.1 hypothetical protein [Pseudomonas sp. PDM32]
MNVDVRRVLNRAEICIEFGRLVILPTSGAPVPQHWFQEHSSGLIREILTTLGIEAYEYCSYTTGYYDKHKAAGVTLQFESAISDSTPYAIFNAELTRSRSTKTAKKGSPLPKGHFRISKRRHLYRFWKSTGLPEPKRLAALHDYMGNLAGILFTADWVKGRENRMDAGSLLPLSVSAGEIRKAFLPDNLRTTPGQAPDNIQTRLPDKDSALSLENRGLQPIPTTCHENHGKAVISERRDKGAGSSPPQRQTPQEQHWEDWLDEYSRPEQPDSDFKQSVGSLE